MACSLPVPRLGCFHFGRGDGPSLPRTFSARSSCFAGGRGSFHGRDCEAVDASWVSISAQALLCVLREAQGGVCIATHVGHFDERFRIWQLSDLPPEPPRCQECPPGVPPPACSQTLHLPHEVLPSVVFPGASKDFASCQTETAVNVCFCFQLACLRRLQRN